MEHEWFGRRPPEQQDIAAWGARAIFTGNKIYLLPDRQSWSRCSPDRKNLLRAWINETALPWLESRIQGGRIATRDSIVLTHDTEGFHVEASPQSSGGYLYIGAWEICEDPTPTALFQF